jgi:hypothetical protein
MKFVPKRPIASNPPLPCEQIALLLISMCVCGCSSADSNPTVEASASPTVVTNEAAEPITPSVVPSVISETEIASIEAAIKKKLPKAYRDFLLKHSGEVADLEKLSDAKKEYRVFPWSAADEITSENVRSAKFLVRGEKFEPFGEEVILIATNGGGDYWFVYRYESKPGVWRWGRETLESELAHKTFDEYLLDLRQ